jgi:hypothetical protein
MSKCAGLSIRVSPSHPYNAGRVGLGLGGAIQAGQDSCLMIQTQYALISTLCTWTWISLKKDGHFFNDPVLDAELFEHRGMHWQLFEILYGLEHQHFSLYTSFRITIFSVPQFRITIFDIPQFSNNLNYLFGFFVKF